MATIDNVRAYANNAKLPKRCTDDLIQQLGLADQQEIDGITYSLICCEIDRQRRQLDAMRDILDYITADKKRRKKE